MTAITENDLKYRYSYPSGGPGFGHTSTGNSSLGGWVSSSECISGILHGLFDVVTGDEAKAGDIEYRCIFIHNMHAVNTLQSPKLWIESEVAGGASVALGVSTSGVSASGLSAGQAEVVADEGAAPAGVAFSSPTTKAAGISLPDIPPGNVCGIWIRRTVPASTAAMNNDGATLKVEGDTAA